MLNKSKPTNIKTRLFLTLRAVSFKRCLRDKKTILPSSLVLILLMALGSNVACNIPFGGAIDYFPTSVATVENHTPINLIVYVNGEPVGIVFSFGQPFDVQAYTTRDNTIDFEDGQFKTIYSYLIKEGTTDNNVIINPADNISALGNTIQYLKGTYIDNPNDELVIIIVNGNPFDIIYPHRWEQVDFVNPLTGNSNSAYFVEARNHKGELMYSLTLNTTQINTQEMHSIPLVPYSLLMTNIANQQLELFINKEYVGAITPYSDRDIIAGVPPRIDWQDYGREYYYFEAKDKNGNVLYSQDFEWSRDILTKYRAISIPFSVEPKIIVYNNTTNALQVETQNIYSKVIQDSLIIQPTEIGYYPSQGFAHFQVIIKNTKGARVYSKLVSTASGDIKIKIPEEMKLP